MFPLFISGLWLIFPQYYSWLWIFSRLVSVFYFALSRAYDFLCVWVVVSLCSVASVVTYDRYFFFSHSSCTPHSCYLYVRSHSTLVCVRVCFYIFLFLLYLFILYIFLSGCWIWYWFLVVLCVWWFVCACYFSFILACAYVISISFALDSQYKTRLVASVWYTSHSRQRRISCDYLFIWLSSPSTPPVGLSSFYTFSTILSDACFFFVCLFTR